VRVHRVASRADLRAFCDLPLRLHPRDRYVPLLASVVAAHARTAELYLVRDGDGTVVGRTSAHRDAAFDAARYAINETKARAPIWKAERFADGHVWIGEPARTGPAGTTEESA